MEEGGGEWKGPKKSDIFYGRSLTVISVSLTIHAFFSFFLSKEEFWAIRDVSASKASRVWRVESVQDFLIKSDMKPFMHLVELSIFH